MPEKIQRLSIWLLQVAAVLEPNYKDKMEQPILVVAQEVAAPTQRVALVVAQEPVDIDLAWPEKILEAFRLQNQSS
jgi:hypothetical protein